MACAMDVEPARAWEARTGGVAVAEHALVARAHAAGGARVIAVVALARLLILRMLFTPVLAEPRLEAL